MMKENKIRVLKVKPNKHLEEFMLENELEAMQEAVGGYIDIVSLEGGVCILLNDEGKLIGLDGNRRIGDDIIVGNFYVCGSNDEGDLVSLMDEEMEKYTDMFYEPEQFTQEEIMETARIDIFFL